MNCKQTLMAVTLAIAGLQAGAQPVLMTFK